MATATISFSWDARKPPNIQAKTRLEHIASRCLDSTVLDTILPYIHHKKGEKGEGDDAVSLRILEWFTTNYSKLFAPKLHESYLQFRNVWKRHLFDCFARQSNRSTIIFLHYKDNKVRTTVAQLQYLLWANQNGVLEYCQQHESAIEAHMVQTLTKNAESKRIAKMIGVDKKRSSLTHVQIPNTCTVYSVETKINLSV